MHQDGACDGLQHYAAMGRDYEGGGQVNLLNREVPADIYTHVANLVEAKILEDLEGSDTMPADREMAELLRGQV